MKILLIVLFFLPLMAEAQQENAEVNPAGQVSIGTRNTFSFFNDDEGMGKGIGGQFRIRLGRRLNSEWFFDYINSRNQVYTSRNDYHIGWSLLFYISQSSEKQLLQPYFIAGHCFDFSKIQAQADKSNAASRLSMATQAGAGTHIRIQPRFDCSLAAQYMLHFGKELSTRIENEEILIEKKSFTHPHGHLLFTISFNYQLGRLWGGKL